jgi:DNA replication protein DnaC
LNFLKLVRHIETGSAEDKAEWESGQERLRAARAENLRHARKVAVKSFGLPLNNLDLIRAGGVRETAATRALALAGDAPLVILSGPTGHGKTVVASKWLYDWLKDESSWEWDNDVTPRLRGSGQFITAGDMADIAFEPSHLKRALCAKTRLVIDELGVEYLDKDGRVMAMFNSVLNQRYASKHLTLITTNLNADEFKERYEGRIGGRIREVGAFMEVGGYDLRACKP